MNSVLNQFSATSAAMSKIKNVALAAILFSLFSLFSMSFQMPETYKLPNDLQEFTECPIADFRVDNNVSPVSIPVSFTNLSQSATSYFWDFGDGNTSTATNPQHTYQDAGTYSVELSAINQECEAVEIIVVEVVNH